MYLLTTKNKCDKSDDELYCDRMSHEIVTKGK